MNKNDSPMPQETNRRLSQSVLWQMQRDYFEQKGVAAWNTGEVPHYVTSNPFMAHTYSQIALGFISDCQKAFHQKLRQQVGTDKAGSPFVYIIELGAGSGRFAWHFLREITRHHPQSGSENLRFKYIMTDLAQANIDFWKNHPRLQPFVEHDLLDFARFDIEKDAALLLQHGGITLTKDTLEHPVVCIANYFFDTIPIDLFTLKGGKLYENLVTIRSPERMPTFSRDLPLNWSLRSVQPGYYNHPLLDRLLEYYGNTLGSTTFSFPYAGLNGLEKLCRLSGGQLLLLSADRGYHREEDLENRTNPGFGFHGGAFSMPVNYHALARYARLLGGEALTLPHSHRSVSINAFLFHKPTSSNTGTRQAWQRTVACHSPDDFFGIKKSIEKNYHQMSLIELIGFLRFSHWDAGIFVNCFEALLQKAKTASDNLKKELRIAVDKVWDGYFHIGEQRDLPFDIGLLLYEIKDYDRALYYYDQSRSLLGLNTSTAYNMALCYYSKGLHAKAMEQVQFSLQLNPANEGAKSLKTWLAGTPSSVAR